MITVIKFYETFTPCEVRILKLLVIEPRVGSYTEIARLLNIDELQSGNVRRVCIRLKDKGYIDIHGDSAQHTKHFMLSQKFITEFMSDDERKNVVRFA